jgi:peroxiredoxin Q/BCP
MRMTLISSAAARRRVAVWLAAVALTCGSAFAAAGTEVQVGDPAPAFTLVGSDGKTYTMSDFIGKKPVVIAWFPKAFTGG